MGVRVMEKVEATFQFLGTGGSMGVPVVACSCAVCTSNSPFNKRTRSSALITIKDKKILIDCGPDFRMQALNSHINSLDGIILTHAHYDHIGGIDDLRGLFVKNEKQLPCLLSKATADDVKVRFNYVFSKADVTPVLRPKLVLQELPKDEGDVDFLGVKIKYLSYVQAGMPINGIIIGNLAYISDIKHYSDKIFEDLKNIDTLILSALRFTPSPMHLTVDEAIDFARKVNAKQTYLTHIAHELDHEKTNAYLPINIQMGYDGLNLTFQAETNHDF